MKNYYRVMLGRKSVYADECFADDFIGVHFSVEQDLTHELTDEWREFNQKFIPLFLAACPEKTKIAAGLACAAVWTLCKGLFKGDIVLCPNGSGRYHVGEIVGDYVYQPNGILPHRRAVKWLNQTIDRSDMSESLRNSTGSIGTLSNVTKFNDEIENLLSHSGGAGNSGTGTASADAVAEDVAAFVMEKHLEDFLVQNWAQTELGSQYDIYQEEGERMGQQYPTDTGPMDILAISKDKKRLLVVELKKGRASDAVVGQIMRYMGYIQEVVAEEGQSVHGAIIALEDDLRIRRALAMMPSITFYRYQISFKLEKAF